MKTAVVPTHMLGSILIAKWRTLIGLPLLNIVLVVIFWQSQIMQYAINAQGVLFMWLVAGLLFLVVQISLQASAWRAARALPKGVKRIEALWALAAQTAVFSLAAIYNVIALVQLVIVGVLPSKPFDCIIILVLLATVLFVGVKYRAHVASPASRLALATGTKAVPQWLQAGWFVVQGSLGMHVVTIAAIVAMGITRYLLTRSTVLQFKNENTAASHAAAVRDVVSIIAMACGWVIGRVIV